jgi:cell division protein FtsB
MMSRRSRTRNPWILRGLAALALAATFGYGPYYLYANSGFARYLQLRRDLVAMQARNTKLRAETDRLAREAEALRTSPRAVENVARADLGWVRPGEVVFETGRTP